VTQSLGRPASGGVAEATKQDTRRRMDGVRDQRERRQNDQASGVHCRNHQAGGVRLVGTPVIRPTVASRSRVCIGAAARKARSVRLSYDTLEYLGEALVGARGQ